MIATVLRFLRASFGAVVGLVLALPVLLVTAPLWLVAAATRRLTRLLEPPGEPWDALIEFEPVIGWKPTPNLRAVGRVEDVFRVSTDADGWRGDTSLAESDLVVFGDSFAWGQGVDDEAFFGNLGDGIAIKAIGSPGYNMVQELLWMERLAPSLAGKLVVWMVFIGNDLYDNLQPNLYRYRMPFVREAPEPGAWEIVTEHVSRVPWTATSKWAYHERLAEMCAPTFVAGRAYSAFAHLVARAAGVLEEAGADLAVLGIPDRAQLDPSRREWLAAMAPDPATFDPDLPDARMGSACADVGVPFVALKDHIRLDHYKLYDIHWNEAGHRRVAAVLEEVYEAAVAERARGAAAVSAEPRRERLPA